MWVVAGELLVFQECQREDHRMALDFMGVLIVLVYAGLLFAQFLYVQQRSYFLVRVAPE